MLPNEIIKRVGVSKAKKTDLEQVEEEESLQSFKNKAISRASSGVFKRPAAGKKIAPKNKVYTKKADKKTESKARKAPGGCIRYRGNPNRRSS